MNDQLVRLLNHLEETLDPDRQAFVHDLHVRALTFEPVDRLPLILQYPLPNDCPFKPFTHREAVDDPVKMLHNELVHAFDTSILCHQQVGDDLPYTVRANFGTVIIASIFGARIEMADDNPPWVLPFPNAEAVQKACDCDALDISRGLCPKIVDFYEFFRQTLAGYPNVKQCVRLVLPDLQGPFDTVELLRGSEIFVDLYERPDWVHELLSKAAQAQVGLARRLGRLLTDDGEGVSHQHATTILGKILVRCDSAINVSEGMYHDHIAPHDEFVLRGMGGGGIHFCGKGEHLVPVMLNLSSLRCIDLGQPELNDLDALYAQAAERRIPLVRVRVSQDDLVSGRVKQRFPTGVSLLHAVDSLEDAKRVFDAYLRSG
ncbi:MAG: hypothetical protein JXQ73_05810 [Phycisphaerae bacterium]|nr:hypothetical protein [Phycisphaerae bacterium]